MTHVSRWTTKDVGFWLQQQGAAPEVVSAFRDNEVDGYALLRLKKDDLKNELGIKSLSMRKDTWDMVERLGLPKTPDSKASRAGVRPLRELEGDLQGSTSESDGLTDSVAQSSTVTPNTSRSPLRPTTPRTIQLYKEAFETVNQDIDELVKSSTPLSRASSQGNLQSPGDRTSRPSSPSFPTTPTRENRGATPTKKAEYQTIFPSSRKAMVMRDLKHIDRRLTQLEDPKPQSPHVEHQQQALTTIEDGPKTVVVPGPGLTPPAEGDVVNANRLDLAVGENVENLRLDRVTKKCMDDLGFDMADIKKELEDVKHLAMSGFQSGSPTRRGPRGHRIADIQAELEEEIFLHRLKMLKYKLWLSRTPEQEITEERRAIMERVNELEGLMSGKRIQEEKDALQRIRDRQARQTAA